MPREQGVDAVVEHRCHVVDVSDGTGRDDVEQDLLRGQVVRLGAAEDGAQWPKRLGGDDRVGLVVGEPTGADEPGPAGPLGGGGDGVVLGSELRDGARPILLASQQLVR